jgi:undecaprenyl phosphate-alpha-L-ara4FN deformylase
VPPSSPPERRVTVRVDVDTHDGLKHGVPRLLALLDRLGVRASFFVTMGPDNSGRAVRRLFTRRGFALKMARTGALGTYGLRTILSGTLLPSRPVGGGFPYLLRRIEEEGHECGVHGWDHVLWHDRIERLDERALEDQLRRAAAAFADATGHHPAGTVAPAWRATEASLAAQDRLPFHYAGDCRGVAPFRVAGPGGAPRRLLQIPATLPTLDEMLGARGMTAERLTAALTAGLRPEGLNVFTVHTEVEGRRHAPLFEAIVTRWLAAGWTFETLGAAASRARSDPSLPTCPLGRSDLPGRPGWVSSQGAPVAPSPEGTIAAARS